MDWKKTAGLGVILLVIVFDRICKSVSENVDFFIFRYSENRGGVFGLFQGQNFWIAFSSILLLSALGYLFFKANNRDSMFIGLVIGGLAGNLYDRLFYRFVIDFIDLGFFPVFNISDVCILFGAVFLIMQKLLDKGGDGKRI